MYWTSSVWQGLKWNFDLRLHLFLTLCNLDTPLTLSFSIYKVGIVTMVMFTCCSKWQWQRQQVGGESCSHWSKVAASTTDNHSRISETLNAERIKRNFKLFFILLANQLKLQIPKARAGVQVLGCVRRWAPVSVGLWLVMLRSRGQGRSWAAGTSPSCCRNAAAALGIVGH